MQPLADRLARGEESAFVELYDSCADRLLRYLAGRLGCPEAAGDALQSAMLRAVKGRRRFAQVENPVAYLFQIARNEAFRLAKKNKLPAPGDAGQTECREPIEPALDQAELASAALGRLALADRELVELKLFAGLTFREIAEVTGQPPGTVASNYRRALATLKPWLDRQLQGEPSRGMR